MTHATPLPDDLPTPVDDGACIHLPGLTLPPIALASTQGAPVTLADLPGRSVVFCCPRTAGPGEPAPADWNTIPGDRGCTPESCAFRDLYRTFQDFKAKIFGVSAHTLGDQRETSGRLRLPYALLSDRSPALARALRLPVFTWRDQTWIQRLTLVVRDGMIEHVFYPVFPPQTHADEVPAWLRSHHDGSA